MILRIATLTVVSPGGTAEPEERVMTFREIAFWTLHADLYDEICDIYELRMREGLL